MKQTEDTTDTSDTYQLLVTAAQAYPEFEKLCLSAERTIRMGFRIFDPWTRLRSPEGREIGRTWLDLIEHLLRRGICIELTVSDFDPIARPDAHRDTWAAIRALHAAAELSGRPELLRARASMHPARLGIFPRILLWGQALIELNQTANRLNQLSSPLRAAYLREAPRLRDMLKERDGRLRARVWPIPNLIPATHHHKLALIDDKMLYIGGLDLNERRYDSPNHDQDANETWHDVQLITDGPAAIEAREHLIHFQEEARFGEVKRHPNLLRTLSQKSRAPLIRMSPEPCLSELADAHIERTKQARHLIYLETQYFRDTKFAKQLAKRAKENPNLGLILILPGAPEEVAFDANPSIDAKYGEYLQAKCVNIVSRAFGERVFIGSPAQKRSIQQAGRHTLYGAPIIYVHSKISIFDDDFALISSANLNGRSFRWDTEAGVSISKPERVQGLWNICAKQWLGETVSQECLAMETAVKAWRKRAQENTKRDPHDRCGFILPYASRPAKRFGHTLPGIPEEMV